MGPATNHRRRQRVRFWGTDGTPGEAGRQRLSSSSAAPPHSRTSLPIGIPLSRVSHADDTAAHGNWIGAWWKRCRFARGTGARIGEVSRGMVWTTVEGSSVASLGRFHTLTFTATPMDINWRDLATWSYFVVS